MGYVPMIHNSELVFNQVKSLIAVERELLITGKKRQMFCDGMRNDDGDVRYQVPVTIYKYIKSYRRRQPHRNCDTVMCDTAMSVTKCVI